MGAHQRGACAGTPPAGHPEPRAGEHQRVHKGKFAVPRVRGPLCGRFEAAALKRTALRPQNGRKTGPQRARSAAQSLGDAG